MNHADKRRGVIERLEATQRACHLPVRASQAVPPQPGLIQHPPDPPGMLRERRAVPVDGGPPGIDLFAAAATFWREAGCQVSESITGYGRTLTAVDPQGYLLTLTGGSPGVPGMLTVASPPTRDRDLSLGLGLLTGALVGPLLSCLALGRFADSLEGAGPLAAFAWLPVLLLVGGLLMARPRTRRFGAGLLIGGCVTGIILSGICSSL